MEAVANIIGLATEPTENSEIFLKELCDLCGRKIFSSPFSLLSSDGKILDEQNICAILSPTHKPDTYTCIGE